MEEQSLINLPTAQLLDKFGAGIHKPGSGSAAALMGILASKLIGTVAKISLSKPKYQNNWPTLEYILKTVEEKTVPHLKELFEEDAMVFDQVIKLRVARDEAISEREKRQLSAQSLEKLREATEIPILICEECISLVDHGIAVFDMGFPGARGDSGAAVSAAIAGGISAIFVISLNLKSFRLSEWATNTRKRRDELHSTLESKQLEALGRVVTLKEEEFESAELFTSTVPDQ